MVIVDNAWSVLEFNAEANELINEFILDVADDTCDLVSLTTLPIAVLFEAIAELAEFAIELAVEFALLTKILICSLV